MQIVFLLNFRAERRKFGTVIFLSIFPFSLDIITTASASDLHADNLVQQVSEYKVVGNLRFHIFLEETIDHDRYLPVRLVYTPKGTALGDIMSVTFYAPTGNDFVEMTRSSLRVKLGLNFGNNNKYDYSAAYVSNVNGTDEDFTIMGNTFNISNIDNGDFDVILGSRLFYVEFPNANTMKHKYRLNDQDVEFEVPITAEDNKVTLDMSAVNPAYREVDMYMF